MKLELGCVPRTGLASCLVPYLKAWNLQASLFYSEVPMFYANEVRARAGRVGKTNYVIGDWRFKSKGIVPISRGEERLVNN